MRPSHICHACGTDIAHAHAQVAPELGVVIAACPCGVNHVRRSRRNTPTSRAVTAGWLVLRVVAGFSGILVGFLCLAGNILIAQARSPSRENDITETQIALAFLLCFHFIGGLWLRAAVVPGPIIRRLLGWLVFQQILFFGTMLLFVVFARESPWGDNPDEYPLFIKAIKLAIAASVIGLIPTAAGYSVANAARRGLARKSIRKRRLARRTNQGPNT